MSSLATSGPDFPDACVVEIDRVPENMDMSVLHVLPVAADRAAGVAALRNWAESAGATISLGAEYCDDEQCAFPVDLGDGTTGVFAFLIHDEHAAQNVGVTTR